MDTDYTGDLIIDGSKIGNKSTDELAAIRNEKIGFVFQFHYLLNEFTALKNVMLPGFKLNKVSEAELEHNAYEYLKDLGIEKLALKNQLSITYEAFADRNYNDDLTLVSRTQNNALLTDKEEVLRHVYEMLLHQQVKTISGTLVPIKAETLCVHGDNTEAIELVQHLYQSLSKKGISIG